MADKEKNGKAGAPRDNRNAAKIGEDLRYHSSAE